MQIYPVAEKNHLGSGDSYGLRSTAKTYTILVWVPNIVKNWCSVQEQWYIKLSITKVVNNFQKTAVYVLVHEQGHMICPLLYGLHTVQYLHKVGGC